MQFLSACHFLFGNIQLFRFASGIRKTIHFHFKQINKSIKPCPLIHGILHYGYLIAKTCSCLFNSGIKISILMIELIHHKNSWLFIFIHIAPHQLRSNFNTMLCIQHHHSCITHSNSSNYFTNKII
ncbi:MAG: hypothetical protein BWY67_01510 [Bacteroidetes bacterium ADurb.Bin397]|nr:MAG: hypothetical protein BWY67_01510 [Bacteroidetes bacterium ADurb.Bin397]